MEGLGECLRDLLDAAAQLPPHAYRERALERIRALVRCDAARWLEAEEPRHDVPADDRFEYREPAAVQEEFTGLCFVRAAPARFSADERYALGLLASQACCAWRLVAQLAMLRPLCRGKRVVALADGSGRVHATHGNFYAALRASWPASRQGALPSMLRAPQDAGATLVVQHQRWQVEALGDLLLITAQPEGAASALTLREQAVAAAVLQTGSQSAAAAHLRVSSHTVRNTLVRIYAKLGVRNRVELAMRLRPELLVTPSAPATATRVRTAIGASPYAPSVR